MAVISNVFVIEFPEDREVPDNLDVRFAVKTNTIEGLKEKLSEQADAPVSVLLIDVIDQDNHPCNAQLTVNGYTYYVNIMSCDLI
jgi:hypothetical protein